MLPELGHFALILALLLAALQAFFGIAGPAFGRERWIAAVTPALGGQAVMVATAVGCLISCFVNNDFSVQYVAENSNSALPLFYRVSAMWGAHEGSLLLWILLLALWSVAVWLARAHLPPRFAARVLGVLGLVSFGFLLFTLATSNPFVRLDPPAPDGRDLNPILQDPGLAIHPPILYTGYVGFAVAFAFACAAMLEGRLDQTWARWTRPWTTAAWAFLTCGIALGSFWAYYELGWGGFWFWDPVENASFMPWLVGTALVHSLAATDKRGLFKSWTLLLAILAFSLSMLGTFLVRSGVLVSVHSFAADPSRGIFILAFLVVMIGGALSLYAWRAPLLKSTAGFELGARESFLLFNNVLLVIAATTVFAGTLAPLISDSLGLGTVSVGPPYFNPTFMLSMLPLAALLCVGIHANWKRGRLGDARRRILYTLLAAAVLACGLTFGIYTHGHVLTPVATTIGIWIILSSLVEPLYRLRRRLTPAARAPRHDDRAHRPGHRRAGPDHGAVLHRRAGRVARGRGECECRRLHLALRGREAGRGPQLRRRRRHVRGQPRRAPGGGHDPAEAPVLGSAPGHLRDRDPRGPRQQSAAGARGGPGCRPLERARAGAPAGEPGLAGRAHHGDRRGACSL